MPARHVSVVIPALDSEATIGACIASLLAQTMPPREIILVDDGCTDRTAEIARGMGARVVVPESRGRAAARNAGWRTAAHGIVAFCDSDTIFGRRWLEFCVGALAKFDAVAERRAVYGPTTFYLRLQQANYDINYAGYVPFCAWVFRRGVLEKVGGFDEAMGVAEERDLGARVLGAGFTIGFEPRAVQYHMGWPRTLFQGIVRDIVRASESLPYYRKHPRKFPVLKFSFFAAASGIGLLSPFVPQALPAFAFLLVLAFLLAFWNHAVRRGGLAVLGAWHAHYLFAMSAISVVNGMAHVAGIFYGILKSAMGA